MQIFQLFHFVPLLKESFSVDLGQGHASFLLIEAQPLPDHGHPGMMRSPFSLLFLHASSVVLPQRIYTMKHSRLGEFGIFMVPVARNQDGFVYQAVFN